MTVPTAPMQWRLHKRMMGTVQRKGDIGEISRGHRRRHKWDMARAQEESMKEAAQRYPTLRVTVGQQ